jgi:tetratricopeptide (TPR) repeat protein
MSGLLHFTALWTGARQRLAVLLIGAMLIPSLVWVCYHRSWDNEPLFDDEPYVLHNPVLEGFSAAWVRGHWQELIHDYHQRGLLPDVISNMMSRPLSYATFEWTQSLGSGDPGMHRRFNVILHAINALLCWRLLVLLGAPALWGWLSAALLALHPLAVESVAHLVQRFELLVVFFGLLSLLLWLQSAQRAGGIRGLRLLAFASMVLAMLCKESAVVLPLLAVCCERLLTGRHWWYCLKRAWPLCLLLLFVPLLVLLAGQLHVQTIRSDWQGVWSNSLQIREWLSYVAIQPWCLLRYLQLLLLPVGLNFDHAVPVVSGFMDARFWLGLAGCMLIVVGLLKLPDWVGGAAAGWVRFGVAWFVLALLPSSLVPLPDCFSEHRTYLASLGLVLAFAGLSLQVALPLRGVSLTSACLIWFGFATAWRVEVFGTREKLWSDCLAKGTTSARVFKGLGIAAHQRGEDETALKHFVRASEVSPNDFESWYNQLHLLLRMGRIREADAISAKALEQLGAHPMILILRAQALIAQERPADATPLLQMVLQQFPDHHHAHLAMSAAFWAQRDPSAALRHLRHAGRTQGLSEFHRKFMQVLLNELVARGGSPASAASGGGGGRGSLQASFR